MKGIVVFFTLIVILVFVLKKKKKRKSGNGNDDELKYIKNTSQLTDYGEKYSKEIYEELDNI